MKLVVQLSFLSILSLGSALQKKSGTAMTTYRDLTGKSGTTDDAKQRMIEPVHETTECEAALLKLYYDEELLNTYGSEEEDYICTAPTDEIHSCEFIGDQSRFAEMCAGYDGRVKSANYMSTGDNCKEINFDPSDPDAELEEIYDLINIPECIPNICTDEEALDVIYSVYAFIEESIEDCELDITFSKAPKSKKMKNAKSMKMKKSSKTPKSRIMR